MRERTAIDKVLDQYRTLEAVEAARQKSTGKGKGGQQKAPKLTEEQAAAATEAERGLGRRVRGRRQRGQGGLLPVQAVLLRVRHRLHDGHRLRRRQPRADLRLHEVRAHRDRRPRDLHRRQAGVEGRLADALGLRARDLRAVRRRPPEPRLRFVVGKDLVADLRLGAPVGPMYAFVGIAGMAKMQLEQGRRADPGRRARGHGGRRCCAGSTPAAGPTRRFNVAFDPELQRLYDEWDALGRKVADGSAQAGDLAAHLRATSTAAGPLPTTPRPMPFRTIASVIDVTRATRSRPSASSRARAGQPRGARPTTCARGSTAPSAGCSATCRPRTARSCAPSPTPSCSAASTSSSRRP